MCDERGAELLRRESGALPAGSVKGARTTVRKSGAERRIFATRPPKGHAYAAQYPP